jgi:hypothetical protein
MNQGEIMDIMGIIIHSVENKHTLKIWKELKNGKRLIAYRANSLHPTGTT